MKNPPTMRNSVEYIECTNILVTYFFFTLHFSHFIPPKWAIIWNRMQCYKNFNTSVVEIIMNTSKIFFQSNNKLMAFVGMLKVNCSLKCILWARKCQCVCIKRNVRLSTLVGLFFLHFFRVLRSIKWIESERETKVLLWMTIDELLLNTNVDNGNYARDFMWLYGWYFVCGCMRVGATEEIYGLISQWECKFWRWIKMFDTDNVNLIHLLEATHTQTPSRTTSNASYFYYTQCVMIMLM